MLNKLKPKSEFSKNVLTLMTGTTIAQAIPIAISPILTRLYTPEDFGLFALFVAITSIFASIANGRYEFAIMVPQKEDDAINIFALGFIINLTLSFTLFIFILLFHDYFVGLLNNPAIGIWLYFIPLAVFLIGLFNILNYFNNRKKHYRVLANTSIIKSIVLAILQLSIGFVHSGVSGLISGQLLSQAVGNAKLLKNLLKDKLFMLKISKERMKSLALQYKDFPKFQAPHAFIHTISSNMPVYLFNAFFGATTVGFYSLSLRIIFSPFMILSGASAQVYNQKLSEVYNENGDSYGLTVSLLFSLLKKIIVPFLIIIIYAPAIFAFIFGEVWREAGVYTQILSLYLLLNILVSTISFIPSLINQQKKAFIVGLVLMGLSIGSISVGAFYDSIYLSLSLFSISNSIILIYNAFWMINALKGSSH